MLHECHLATAERWRTRMSPGSSDRKVSRNRGVAKPVGCATVFQLVRSDDVHECRGRRTEVLTISEIDKWLMLPWIVESHNHVL